MPSRSGGTRPGETTRVRHNDLMNSTPCDRKSRGWAIRPLARPRHFADVQCQREGTPDTATRLHGLTSVAKTAVHPVNRATLIRRVTTSPVFDQS